MKKLKYKDLYVGLEVVDIDFDMEGIIEKCDDPHNVIVGHGDAVNIYCFVDDCEMEDLSLVKKEDFTIMKEGWKNFDNHMKLIKK